MYFEETLLENILVEDEDPEREGENIAIYLDEDLLLSEAQTFTMGVNLIGAIPADDLATRIIANYPDVKILFEQVLGNQRLKAGQPYLYKRKALIDLPIAKKWFLLFPVQEEYFSKPSLEFIGRGLDWLVKHAQENALESLALPALGCTQYGLTWEEVGPLMCQKLAQLEIPVEIYLPTEYISSDHALTVEFLFGKEGR